MEYQLFPGPSAVLKTFRWRRGTDLSHSALGCHSCLRTPSLESSSPITHWSLLRCDFFFSHNLLSWFQNCQKATDHEGTCVLLSRTLEVLLESTWPLRHCCLCWQHGQNVFPKLKCRADSLFGRSIKKSPSSFTQSIFPPSYFSGGVWPFITLSVVCHVGEAENPTWQIHLS